MGRQGPPESEVHGVQDEEGGEEPGEQTGGPVGKAGGPQEKAGGPEMAYPWGAHNSSTSI